MEGKSQDSIRSLALAVVVLIGFVACATDGPSPPNFVVILIDDLGYADIGAYGSERNRTPHLDRMAAEGLRFTDFHSNGPMCTPTRAALLTGLYPHRFGPMFESALSGLDEYDQGLPLDAVTVAEELGEVGYSTAMYGKWHLGYHPPFMPTRQGFEEFRGLTSGDGDHHSHIDRSGRRDWWHNEARYDEEGYGVDLITKHSVDFIRSQEDKPFFLYVAHLAIHFPWQGPDDVGYREEGGNYHNLTKLGSLTSLDISGQVNKMVEAIDGSVGAILDTLGDEGLAGTTFVLFCSDNGGYRTHQGGHFNISENGPLRGQKGDVYEGGHRVPAIAWWPGRIAPGESEAVTATFDVFPTLLEFAGVDAGGRALDGRSLAPLLIDRRDPSERTLFWRIRSEAAARKGRWKLVRNAEEAAELYDLSADIGESENLSAQHPQVVAELEADLQRWEESVGNDHPR